VERGAVEAGGGMEDDGEELEVVEVEATGVG
jgi:hypothetical protein